MLIPARTLPSFVALVMTVSVVSCSKAPVSSVKAETAASADALATPGAAGPYSIFEQDYRLPAAVDPRILDDRPTEIWGRLYMPAAGSSAPGRLPILVFLHGNHGTCGRGTNPRIDDRVDYTSTGQCPNGYVVTPNHRGYDYLARNMASWGFAVISINANLGITSGSGVEGDSGLNLARGRLVLSHLALLAKWNKDGGSADTAGVDLKDRLDFDHIGMMGHSRGGEGVRAAYAQYNDAGSPWPAAIGPMNVRGIFEIAPVDGQTSRVLDAMNTAWTVMIGLCDGDVSNFQGVKPFDRMLKQTHEDRLNPKSTLVVWGANHNFFNTEWQTSDAPGCDDHTPIFDTTKAGSAQQQQIALSALSAFFRTHVGGETSDALARFFDPSMPMPKALAALTPFGRDYVATPDSSETMHLVDFNDGQPSNAKPNNLIGSSVNAIPFHDDRNALTASWSAPNANTNVAFAFGATADLSQVSTIDLDLESLVLGTGLDFDVRLVAGGGASAPVSLSQVMAVQGAEGRNLFQTVRFDASLFTGIDLKSVTGLEVIFDKSNSGTVAVGAVRASRTAKAGPAAALVDAAQTFAPAAGTRPAPFVGRGQVTDAAVAQGSGAKGPDGQPQQAYIALKVQSSDQFPTRSELAVLHINDKTYDLSSYDNNDLATIVFKIPAQDFKALTGDETVTVSYGALATSNYIINAGTLTADIVKGVQ